MYNTRSHAARGRARDAAAATTFLDLCAAGAPLAAIARCLQTAQSCTDQLHLAQAVGKQYRDLVLQQVTELASLNLEVAHRTDADVSTLTRFLQRLPNVQDVSPTYSDQEDVVLYDTEGLELLRLLPKISRLYLAIGELPCGGGRYPDCPQSDIFRAVAALTTLEDLSIARVSWPGFEEDEESEADDDVLAPLAHLTCLTRLDFERLELHADGANFLTGAVEV